MEKGNMKYKHFKWGQMVYIINVDRLPATFIIYGKIVGCDSEGYYCIEHDLSESVNDIDYNLYPKPSKDHLMSVWKYGMLKAAV